MVAFSWELGSSWRLPQSSLWCGTEEKWAPRWWNRGDLSCVSILLGSFYVVCLKVARLLSEGSLNGHLHCFHVLAVVNSVALNIGVHTSFWNTVVSRYMPRSGIAGSHRNSICSFLKIIHTVFIVVASTYIGDFSMKKKFSCVFN